MITVRNKQTGARALTVRAGEALVVGQVVKLTQGESAGGPPKVVKCSAADLADPTVFKGIVDYVQDNDLAVDFVINLEDSSLGVNLGADGTVNIPANAQCVIWYNQPIVGYHSSGVDEDFGFATAREGDTKVAFKAESGKPTLYDADAEDTGEESYMGVVYQHEGPEVTILFTEL